MFREGRTETVRSCTRESTAFVQAMVQGRHLVSPRGLVLATARPLRVRGQTYSSRPCFCPQNASLQPTRLLCPWDSPGKNPGVGSHALLQGISAR